MVFEAEKVGKYIGFWKKNKQKQIDCVPIFQSTYRHFYPYETVFCSLSNDLMCYKVERKRLVNIFFYLSTA